MGLWVPSTRGRWLLDGRGADAMTGLDVLLAVAGLIATLLVVVGMILITPRGAVDDGTDPQGEDLSRAEATGPERDRLSGGSRIRTCEG